MLMESDRHRGIVKFFRGSFGWVKCGDVAEKIGDRDIFLHKNQLNSVLWPIFGIAGRLYEGQITFRELASLTVD